MRRSNAQRWVGLTPTILPTAGQETFTLEPGKMELGVGLHGEAGVAKLPIESADQIAARFVAHLGAELELTDGARLAILVDGLGATPLDELYLLYRAVHLAVTRRGAIVERAYVGEYPTSLEMAGASLTVLALDDDLVELLQRPANSPFYKEGTNTGPSAMEPLETAPAQPTRPMSRDCQRAGSNRPCSPQCAGSRVGGRTTSRSFGFSTPLWETATSE